MRKLIDMVQCEVAAEWQWTTLSERERLVYCLANPYSVYATANGPLSSPVPKPPKPKTPSKLTTIPKPHPTTQPQAQPKSVKQKLVHRIDPQHIPDFNKHMQTYHHNKDWTQSGIYGLGEKIPKGMTPSKGLYAATRKGSAPYAAPRDTKWVTHDNNLVFDKADEQRIRNHRPTITSFDASKFRDPGSSGEFFSENPGKPVRQTTIKDPVKHMQKHGYKVNFVDDLHGYKKDLENRGIEHNAEGF